MEFIVESLLAGTVQRLTDDGETSAIGKSPVDGPRRIGWLGLAGDQQADLSVHGGADKALHHYPRDHYPFWRAQLDALPVLERAGAFGENISTRGITEDTACIGDSFRLGTATVEIAQGRQPCWKQAYRLGSNAVLATMVKTQRCGWYYRVIEEGMVAAGDGLTLLDRPHAEWTVARVIGLLVGGDARRDPAAVRALAGLRVLADGWRGRAAQLAQR